MSDAAPPALLDSSYIVRYLTQDPPAMAEAAARVIDSQQTLFISPVIIAESAYVLTSVYQITRTPVVETLMDLLQRRNIRPLNLSKSLALDALRLCKDSNRVSFADALLWAEALHANTPRIYTFDRRFPADGVELLGSM